MRVYKNNTKQSSTTRYGKNLWKKLPHTSANDHKDVCSHFETFELKVPVPGRYPSVLLFELIPSPPPPGHLSEGGDILATTRGPTAHFRPPPPTLQIFFPFSNPHIMTLVTPPTDHIPFISYSSYYKAGCLRTPI